MNYELRELEFKEQEDKRKKDNIDVIYNKICDYLNKFDKLSYDDKNQYLQEIIKECVWDGKELKITL